ncbi:hypothetical protein ACWEWX_26940, partial [Streptomyces asiaticus]
TTPAITLDLLRELLAVEPYKPPASVLRRARTIGGHLAPLVLSVAEHEGVAMGAGSRGELARMRERARIYEQIAHQVASVPSARVVKGPSLAAHYPPGVLRPQGDVDVVTVGQEPLWVVAQEVVSRWPVAEINLTVVRAEGAWHVVLVLAWPSEDDPLMDPELNVEIATLAFSGRSGGAPPPRIDLPADAVVADVLMLAEERFQRPFTAKDSLDLALVLGGPRAPDPRFLAKQATVLRLAPELRELCERTRALPSLAPAVPQNLIDALRLPSARELRLREVEQAQPPAALPLDPDGSLPPDALAVDGPVHGMLLARRDPAGPPTEGLQFRPFSAGTIIRTPLADFLLVTEELVDPGQYATALAERGSVFPA